jgi:hypothetical protein
MPRYCYSDDEGNVIIRKFGMNRIPKTFKLGGKVFTRDYRAEHSDFKNTPGNWPMKSDAAGVHPDQIQEAVNHSIKNGVPTSFTSDGRAIFTDANHRKKYCRLIGLHDRNGGYRDP